MHDEMDILKNIIGFVEHDPLAVDEFYVATALEYIPLELRPQVYKTFFHGYQRAFAVVTFILPQSVMPFPPIMKAVIFARGFRGHDCFASGAIAFFLSKRGLPDFAFDCSLDVIEDQSPLRRRFFR
jgi:hypothetical protein